MKYKIGDRVVCNTSFYNCPQKGWSGKVVYLDNDCVGVEWDRHFPDGHTCGGSGEEYRCRYYTISVRIKKSNSASILDTKPNIQMELFDEV